MSTDTLTFGPMTDLPQYTLHAWRLEGPRGAITFRIGLYTSIELHSRTPFYKGDEAMSDCPAVDFPCYYGGSGERGRELARSWREAGQDDAVIRAALESSYARLPERAAVR